MIERDYVIRLFDLYGEFLTDKQREYFKDYYYEDLSLNEIAENNKVSKALVGKTIKVTEEKLIDFDKKLGLVNLYDKINEVIDIEKDEKIKNILKEIVK